MESVDELLERFDPEQREVAMCFGVPLCVRTGAGMGKARAIAYRIAHAVWTGILSPRNVMVLMLTSRATGEPRSRLHDLGVCGAPARIFHAAALH